MKLWFFSLLACLQRKKISGNLWKSLGGFVRTSLSFEEWLAGWLAEIGWAGPALVLLAGWLAGWLPS